MVCFSWTRLERIERIGTVDHARDNINSGTYSNKSKYCHNSLSDFVMANINFNLDFTSNDYIDNFAVNNIDDNVDNINFNHDDNDNVKNVDKINNTESIRTSISATNWNYS